MIRLAHPLLTSLIAVFAAALALPAAGASVVSHPFTTGLAPSAEVYAADPVVVFDRMHAAGMSSMDVVIDWVSTAPQTEPTNWNPADPGDPHYDWSSSDARILALTKAGFEPIAIVAAAPVWARLVPQFPRSAPNAEDFAAFMHAAAERYSGRRAGLPRVRYWRIWSEPNISSYLKPQFDQKTKKFVSPEIYRNMVNRSAAEIHAVNKDNVVIAGGTALLIGITPPNAKAMLDTSLFAGSRSFTRTSGGDCRPDRDFPIFIRWYREGKLKLDELITNRYKLEQINDAVDDLAHGRILGRGILTFS